MSDVREGPNYWDYLKLDRLLDLQGGLEGDDARLAPDELHFIVVHQVFELWFKLILSELRLARDHLAAPRVPEERIPYVVHHLRRVNEIMRHCVGQFAIMETLTPQDFLAFRDKLTPASGFQSYQMREIEILLGLQDAQRAAEMGINPFGALQRQAKQSPRAQLGLDRIEAARAALPLRSALHNWLYRTPIQGSTPEDPDDVEAVDRFVSSYLKAMQAHHTAGHETRQAVIPDLDLESAKQRLSGVIAQAWDFLHAADVDAESRPRVKRIRAALVFIESYRALPLLAWPRLLIDAVVELEEQFVLWRTRHARMVERVIGRRIGTGGSSGVDYLDATAKYRVFRELWTVRTILLPKRAVPPLENAQRYGFAGA
ncbi:MAG: tryptophan 2,3-dioxygenase [Planctomycetes bacterium]|nr:tryptophan 2,3-dioxygenase [Planctomycetota bacterium]